MFAWLNELMVAMNAALQQGAALSILIGFAVAFGGTQFMKFWLNKPSRRMLNGIALVLGFSTTFLMWPVHELNAVRFFLALSVGLMTPPIYKLVLWKFPAMEAYLSPAKDQ